MLYICSSWQIFSNCTLIELGVDITGRIHSTYLKNRKLANVLGLNSYKEGQEATMMLDMRCMMRAWTMLMMRPFVGQDSRHNRPRYVWVAYSV